MRTLLLTTLLVAVVAAAFILDGAMCGWVSNSYCEWLEKGAGWISRYLDWPGLMCLGLGGLLVACIVRRRSWAKIVLAMMIASTLAGIIANASRLLTGRTRPRAEVVQGWYGPVHNGQLLIGRSSYNSFPSGHTSTAIGFAGILMFVRRRRALACTITAFMLAVAWSRVYLGAHYLSDVIVAGIVGLLVARWVWRTQQLRLNNWAERVLAIRRLALFRKPAPEVAALPQTETAPE